MAPDPVGPPGGKRRVQVGVTEIAKASVMRLEYSLEKSSCLIGGSSPLFVTWKVGIENSSLTPGSSIVRVAGKNRLPAISCAAAPERGVKASMSPGKARPRKRVDIGLLRQNFGREWRRQRNGATLYDRCAGPRGSLLG